MSFRHAFLKHVGPGAFSGITLGDWLRVLWDNRFCVHPLYWPRAGNIAGGGVINSIVRRWELWRYGRRIREAMVLPPLFVLGVWRSGTTHLHNLLAQDERFAFPNTYQVFYPHTFLSTERRVSPMMASFMPNTRPQDNVKMGVDQPQEDEFAQCAMTGYSCNLTWAFPRGVHYDRYLTFADASPAEIRRWQQALRWFVQKLSFKYGRPLVLKSPAHTGRIRMLLEVFPQARFVHIHRHPYAVHRSSVHTFRHVQQWWAMQRYERPDMEDVTLRQYRELCEAYFSQRSLIEPGRLHELSYCDLERDPMGQMRTLYEALSLPDFAVVEPKLRGYLDSLAGYKKNDFPPLAPVLRERIARECRPCFDHWGYSIDGPVR